MVGTIKSLRSMLSRNERALSYRLCFISIAIALIETLGVSAIMPFITVASDLNVIQTNEHFFKAYTLLGFNSSVDFVVSFGCCLIAFYLFRAAFNLYYSYAISKFTQKIYVSLSSRLLGRYLGMPYQEYHSKNSSSLTKSIVTEAYFLANLSSTVFLILSEMFVLIFIYAVMLFVNTEVSLYITILAVVSGLIMKKTISVKINQAGINRAEAQKHLFEVANRSFGNFKMIKLMSGKDNVLSDFKRGGALFSKANITNLTLSAVPKIFLELLGFGIIVSLVIYLVWIDKSDVSQYLGLLSFFLIAMYRLLPSATRVLNGYNQIMYYQGALSLVKKELGFENEELGDSVIAFSESIALKNICFEYVSGKPILREVNLAIKKGSKVAFIGESGGGKSTLVDLIAGLLKPTSGHLFVDHESVTYKNAKSWRSAIGYIPQNVYLFDGSIGQNISMGFDYDERKVNRALKVAKIFDFVVAKGGHSAPVGEGGIMLSGGQKQRLAIARAFYNDPEVLVLDEATSALDDETEKQIMDEIYAIGEKKTIIIIAHRTSTLDRCDEIFKISNGKAISLGFSSL